jgi:lysine-N-methylase
VLRPQFEQWVQIEPREKSGNHFAKIVLDGSSCPFLSDKLCSIQSALGEDHLSKVCATFPRIRNHVGGTVERSLDLSCPEAARLCLSDPAPASFQQVTLDPDERQERPVDSENAPPYFREIRSAILSVLQNRKLAVTKRLILVGHICDKLDKLSSGANQPSVPQLLQGVAVGIDAGLYDTHLQACSADATLQVTTVLELIMARLKLDFTPQRYLDQYLEFVAGLHLEPGLNLRECGDRYARAYALHYRPFIATHEYVLEHFLVYYAYRTLLPFGSKALRKSMDGAGPVGPFTSQYMLMASYFSIIRATMIGLAARYGSAFGADHAIRCIQVSSRTLEHCTAYPLQVLHTLSGKGINNAAAMSVLTEDPSL